MLSTISHFFSVAWEWMLLACISVATIIGAVKLFEMTSDFISKVVWPGIKRVTSGAWRMVTGFFVGTGHLATDAYTGVMTGIRGLFGKNNPDTGGNDVHLASGEASAF